MDEVIEDNTFWKISKTKFLRGVSCPMKLYYTNLLGYKERSNIDMNIGLQMHDWLSRLHIDYKDYFDNGTTPDFTDPNLPHSVPKEDLNDYTINMERGSFEFLKELRYTLQRQGVSPDPIIVEELFETDLKKGIIDYVLPADKDSDSVFLLEWKKKKPKTVWLEICFYVSLLEDLGWIVAGAGFYAYETGEFTLRNRDNYYLARVSMPAFERKWKSLLETMQNNRPYRTLYGCQWCEYVGECEPDKWQEYKSRQKKRQRLAEGKKL